MIAVTVLLGYGIVAVLTGRTAVRAFLDTLVAADHAPDREDLVAAGLVGLLVGLFWPLVLVGWCIGKAAR